MTPPKVALLTHTGRLGGAELALVRLVDAVPPGITLLPLLFEPGPLADVLSRSGHTASLIRLAGDLQRVDRARAGQSLRAIVSQGARSSSFALRLARRLRELDVDVVHANSLKSGLIGAVAAMAAKRPFVWYIHDRISPDYLPDTLVRLVRGVARRADAVLVNSEATASTLPGTACTVAYPGFSSEQVRPLAERVLPGTPVVGILGRISPTKGQLEFVRAASRVLARHPGTRFRIIGSAMFGEEAYETKVRAECARLGLREAVEFVGFTDDPSSALDALTVAVHASPTPEPFGQVIVEAMIRGVPVVATHGGGVDEIVAPQGEEALGWLVQPRDVDELAAAIIEALDDPTAAQLRAARAWESATRRFPVERTAEVVSQVWRSVARDRGRRTSARRGRPTSRQ